MKVNTYYNEEYSSSTYDFETIKKPQQLANAIAEHDVYAEVLKLCDPAGVPGALARAEAVIKNGISSKYLSALMTGNPRSLAESNGFPWDANVYQGVLNSTAGILCAIDDVLDNGHHVAASLSCGMHHARPDHGAGFCAVNSLALGAKYAAEKTDGVVILDLDAHCGGGTNHYLQLMPGFENVKQVDVSHNGYDLYFDEDGAHSTLTIVTEESLYLDAVAKALEKVASLNPKIVFYNAGVDIFPKFSPETVAKRDAMVASAVTAMKCKVVMAIAGGYGKYEQILPLHLTGLLCLWSAGEAMYEQSLLPNVVAAPGTPNAGQFLEYVKPILAN